MSKPFSVARSAGAAGSVPLVRPGDACAAFASGAPLDDDQTVVVLARLGG